MPVGIACPVCGHLTMTIPISMLPSLAVGFDGILRKSTGRLAFASCRCGGVTGGASRTLFERASASGGCVLAAGLGPTGRIPSQADPRCELNDFLAGSVESPGEVLGKLAAHASQGDL